MHFPHAVGKQAWPACLVALLVVAGPSLASSHPAPTALDGTYDPDTSIFTLTWEYDTATYAVDEYRIYINDQYVGATSVKEYDDDLSGWEGTDRTYQVSAVVDGVEGNKSAPLLVTFVRDGPYICPIIGFAVYTHDPWLAYGVYPECVPLFIEHLGGVP